MDRYEYTTVQDLLRTVIGAFGAVAEDEIRAADERRQARADQATAAEQLQRLRTTDDAEIERVGREYAAILAALNR